ncbi:RNA polymerase sigma factor FliA [Enterovibrio norvegicus]|uniref:RNA polymerase sigma factor FliA n=2 Tax=Enterovibrio norvegicus TaxID=188144 RepID=A0A2N7L5T0_9GAMM|nr:RNA polymerase sigma factor FliA [Enterovibrio norvegicus]OEE61943.1 RNA polymerase sigma factor FliA [Enterovibrio norvegicus]OEF58863.1 RNA polymerase sigma factor FliA [Enterovibrio norvegicus]OEF59568.1 RNA polymerase sigma factor FliA [Enterovibrio norvegicus]PMH65633.1 RNA polymerase sigma factor FliA [Enterovibrio norvegicus]PMI32951.1 RNA polymerase sigma factor FliA [Enterovibrio norvegicus]
MNRALTYSRTGASTETVIEQYSTLVKRIAHHLISRLPPNVQVEDLIQAGMIGLLEAQQNYDPSKGASFETYAGIRIRGAMLDDIRKGDWVPRSVHKNNRQISDAIAHLEGELGRDPNDKEISKRLGMSLEQYHNALNDINSGRLIGMDDLGVSEDAFVIESHREENLPFQEVEEDSFKVHLAKAITELPEREALVLSLYYDEELNLKEIGAIIGVSESRVCQIQNQAMQRLRTKLSAWSK